MAERTAENCTICRQESVLQCLFKILSLECLLTRDNLVDVFSSKKGNLVTAMAVIYTKVADDGA